MASRRWQFVGLVALVLTGCPNGQVLDDLPPPRLTLPVPRERIGPAVVSQSEPAPAADPKLYSNVVRALRKHYYRDLPAESYRKPNLDALLEEFDPYTMHVPSDRMAALEKMTVGRFAGIGVQVSLVEEQLTVITPLVDTPAYRAGIVAGDRITAIDGRPTRGMLLDEAVHHMMGPRGTTVKLTVRHPGRRQPVTVPVRRDTIRIRTVAGEHRGAGNRWEFLLDPTSRVGYVRLTAFTTTTGEDLRRVLRSLRAQGMRGLVLDLRNNPGGVVSGAVEVADLFLAQGVIVSVRERNGSGKVYRASAGQTWSDLPLVVLVNRYSASASEIVAAALQDHRRAPLVGERTYGKGSVQRYVMLGDGQGALKVTTALYYSPKGRTFHRTPGAEAWGLEPDVTVELTEDETLEVARWRRDRDAIGRPTAPAEWRRRDPQLRRAVELIDAKLHPTR